MYIFIRIKQHANIITHVSTSTNNYWVD